ncbi:MAG: polysaccharide biosynthesis protein PslH [Actinomycetota bacterium]|jgi:glycosyltransferase involved in cell wall biosynthesis
MRLAFVSRHNPTPEGSQDGKIFRALVEGLIADGHDVTAMSWAHDQPHDEMPDWCEFRYVPPEAPWTMHARAVVRPRWDAARIDWRPPADAFAIAEDPLSWAVVARHPRRAVVFHYLTKIDAPALRRPTPPDVQDMRHERRVGAHAPFVMAMSERVAHAIDRRAHVVPMAYPVPPTALDLVDEPVVALLASWNWAPNHAALTRLLGYWPAVRDAVPGARLVLAGRGLDPARVGTIGGVEHVGAVGVPGDVLARAAVVAYPCPGTSGPKVKVIEALAYGVPVVTTPSGVEGLHVAPQDGPVVADDARFADALIAVLRDPARRAAMAARGRDAVTAAHAPAAAARARVAAISGVFRD